jgi:hypothetical protein
MLWDSCDGGVNFDRAFKPVAALRNTLSLHQRNDTTAWFLLLAHLSLAQARNATDLHDRIYGVLGVLPTLLHAGIIPDYKMDISTLFTRATKRLLAADQTLGTLCWKSHPFKNLNNFPSWGVD